MPGSSIRKNSAKLSGLSRNDLIPMTGGRRKGDRLVLALLFLVLLASLLLALGVGGGRFRWTDVGSVFRYPALTGFERIILFEIRLPRIVLAGLVGSGLALCGGILQGLFQNPLVDPYVLGISSGAAFGAVLAILTGTVAGLLTIPLFAFSFALLTAVLVFSLGRVGRKFPLSTMLLSGMAVGFFFSALITLGMFVSGEELHQVVFWLMGGFWNRSWRDVGMVLPLFLVSVPVLLIHARELNALLLGERVAASIGVETERVKKRLLVVSSLLVAACVSVSGVIGFIGLVIPHLVRLLVGQDHRRLLPATSLVGGIVLLWADTLSRTIVHPSELPVGIVTSLLGVPFFMYLLRRGRGKW
ncbi:MAG TPA: iron ABC transporter permease [Atribacteraceae bacterium]|nr:iron ABC transporter permease [Atribacteraceae bacterium]